jgi:hypothetical protein
MKMLAAIGPEITERLKHLITALLDVQLVHIFQYLHKHYGHLTARDINELQAEQATPLRNADDFGKMPVTCKYMQSFKPQMRM